MNSGNQITARTVSIGPMGSADAGQKVTVHLSAAPGPRWQACFNFLLRGRDVPLLRDHVMFEGASFSSWALPGRAEAFREELPRLLASTGALAHAQGLKDAAR
ncbi:hypothetical protein [Xanthomonas campestris]|uniref:Uncharacterized protein n=1 Tax=Xanthomonas campestris pv. campestris (strain 8004) TaxID=314565 RepID=A0A0H2X7I9_XANC8|nr:hypothetical protein [Xanthomonas campestris]AAY49191.1 conserved hypothetical protein [Xanthomonas campestris pv. campestris str. 8004]MBD8249213.1 hypothetical protein [Xanthomonas campestris]MCC5075963.1 hypothetical protein [Xanthomonas campestris pv. campestris]MCF8820409.1 hypothetical protein [Xanthomonas campestris pv. campestris]MCF8832425.1 hypothetical protein [Xanthomonas campestris pv. campestris]